MAANMGNKTVTTTGLKVVNLLTVEVNGVQKQLLLVSGSVPGKPGSLLTVLPFVRVGQKVS
jgi:ribosomal protein L3